VPSIRLPNVLSGRQSGTRVRFTEQLVAWALV
jgi:hypothetical protein